MIVYALMFVFETPFASYVVLQCISDLGITQYNEEFIMIYRSFATILFVNRAVVIAIVRMTEPQFL